MLVSCPTDSQALCPLVCFGIYFKWESVCEMDQSFQNRTLGLLSRIYFYISKDYYEFSYQLDIKHDPDTNRH